MNTLDAPRIRMITASLWIIDCPFCSAHYHFNPVTDDEREAWKVVELHIQVVHTGEKTFKNFFEKEGLSS